MPGVTLEGRAGAGASLPGAAEEHLRRDSGWEVPARSRRTSPFQRPRARGQSPGQGSGLSPQDQCVSPQTEGQCVSPQAEGQGSAPRPSVPAPRPMVSVSAPRPRVQGSSPRPRALAAAASALGQAGAGVYGLPAAPAVARVHSA